MKSHNNYIGIDAYAVGRIRYHAWQLSKSRYFSVTDIEDIEQELVIDLLLKLPSYNPAKSSKNTFISIVIETRSKILLRDAKLQKAQGHVQLFSLYDPVSKADEYEDLLIIDTLPSTASFYTFYDIDDGPDIETTIDVQKIVQHMPTTLGDLCALLQSMTITEIAQLTGVTYWVIQKQVHRLRKAFISAGIKKFA